MDQVNKILQILGFGISEDPGRAPVSRGKAAALLHEYLRDQLHLKDLPDISGAEALRDLYDCRVCVNHIAQVYLRGIMDGIPYQEVAEDFLIFDHRRLLTEEEALQAAERIAELSSETKNIYPETHEQ
ncbi:MAG: hypothetical protein K6A92_04595 [Lachnospiraceae bacterium]|nr:hypothetical protein [Lachnospiraceae bacterium]